MMPISLPAYFWRNMDIIAGRSLNSLYPILDILWLLAFLGVLLKFRRFGAILAGLAGGLVYFIVDYGIFYLALGTRVINGADPFWFLLWLSISYGFTNVAWIWLLLDQDAHAVEWSLLIIAAWFAVALLSQNFGTNFPVITIHRGTANYHGVMTLILLVGYGILIWQNLARPREQQVNLLWLLAIGIGVQFSWEAVLLLTGIRPMGFLPLVVNALIETNLGMPYFYWIHSALKRRRMSHLQAEKQKILA